MNLAHWNDCSEHNHIRKVSPDEFRAQSLIETAQERIKQIKTVTEQNSNFVFEDYYTSLMEILQAITFRQGFNILNHKCLGYYLRDIMNRQDLYEIFDDLRYKRNSLTYYGNRMDHNTAKKTIEKCKLLLKSLEY